MPQGPGAPYPHPFPAPGSNAIGKFVIGTSPIGTIPPFDVWQTVLTQYANSKILAQLCNNMAQYVDRTADMDAFYDTIWNVDSAVGYGLDVWGRIVGVVRTIPGTAPGSFFGFEESGSPTQRTGFGQGTFFGGGGSSNNFTLVDSAFRPLVMAKALANICDGSIPAINQLLLNLFPGLGNSYIADNLNLTMTYTFQFAPSPVQLAIITNSGVLPRTSGVSVLVSHP